MLLRWQHLPNQNIIEISSNSEPEVNLQVQSVLKKQTLSAPTNESPSKKRLKKVEVIELLDSDDEVPTIKAEILPHKIPMSTSSGSEKQDIKMNSQVTPPAPDSKELKPQIKSESFKLEINESAKDSDGRYIVTKKVKVNKVETLSEVPKRWPVPAEDLTVAYVIDLNEDQRWREGNSKDKAFDQFLKQEVTSLLYFHHL